MTAITPQRCYRDADTKVYFTREAHRPDCADGTCRGCKVCHERHCDARTNCTWHLIEGELTCGRCIASPRRDIKWIEALSALMLPAAMSDGVDSEAAMLAGPAADPRGMSERRVAQKRYLGTYESLGRITEEQHLHALTSLEEDDWRHAYSVLTRWQMMLAEDYGHDLPARLSVSGAAAYLDRHLHYVAQDPEQDFVLLARELKKCRQHLESVLHNDTRQDVGAPCYLCRDEGLEKPPRLRRTWGHWCDDDDCAKVHHADTTNDVWVCPRNHEHKWSEKDYRGWVEERVKSA